MVMIDLLRTMSGHSFDFRKAYYIDTVIRKLGNLTSIAAEIEGATLCLRMYKAAVQVVRNVFILAKGLSSQLRLDYMAVVQVMGIAILNYLLPKPFRRPDISINIASGQWTVHMSVWSEQGSSPDMMSPLPRGLRGWRMLLGDALWEQRGGMVWCGDLHKAADGEFIRYSLHSHASEFANDIYIAHQMLRSAAHVMWCKHNVKVIDGMFRRPLYGDDLAGRWRYARINDLHWVTRKLWIAHIQMRRQLQCRKNVERNAIKQFERVLEKLMI